MLEELDPPLEGELALLVSAIVGMSAAEVAAAPMIAILGVLAVATPATVATFEPMPRAGLAPAAANTA